MALLFFLRLTPDRKDDGLFVYAPPTRTLLTGMWTKTSLSVYRFSRTWTQLQGQHTQLDNVTDESHDQETSTDSLADLDELALVGCYDKNILA